MANYPDHESHRVRNLTDADVEALVGALQARITKQFYADLGKGLWGMVWRGVIMGLVAIAAWGAWHAEH